MAENLSFVFLEKIFMTKINHLSTKTCTRKNIFPHNIDFISKSYSILSIFPDNILFVGNIISSDELNNFVK